MTDYTLVIGNKTYSSWSLRPWLAMRQAGLDFDEHLIPLDMPDSRARLHALCPAGKVPVLRNGDVTVWESLAILEYIADRHPEARLWPEDPVARGVARALCAEMHAGFSALRQAMPMNVRKALPGKGQGAPGVLRDVARICALWIDCRQRYGADGPFLFGAFTNADAMFAPVASRFRTYAVPVNEICQAYIEAIHALPAMVDWVRDATAEPWVIEADEV
ncbi:glutathione S-transferase family protein [Roseospira visakhapatnamensis]|uniref:Glutathione S-transferase n=1 Tax=Roseospira visakhapatnamensis TaxID=390880 RepID=A0A7W6R9N5_9PROT|nr:glutathione S-transferase family protein [Roseospira visakhapatnamensis]MBB4264443.1 glutathione S-transferase [Roseospira visakhapatnamensis]